MTMYAPTYRLPTGTNQLHNTGSESKSFIVQQSNKGRACYVVCHVCTVCTCRSVCCWMVISKTVTSHSVCQSLFNTIVCHTTSLLLLLLLLLVVVVVLVVVVLLVVVVVVLLLVVVVLVVRHSSTYCTWCCLLHRVEAAGSC